MRRSSSLVLIGCLCTAIPCAAGPPAGPLPAVADGWSIERVAEAPGILFPTAIVAAPDGTVYLGSDPMDMPGPPTAPIDSVVAIKDGKVRTFADKLWSVMGLEWVDGTLYVVHAPFLSAFRDTDGDGKADARVDLITGLGPRLPGFNGINDHIASGIRLGMDGFLYIAVGDKGIPRGVGRDGTTIQLHGGGVIRIRPDGTGLEVVSTGERNPLSVALSATDEVFTYGNDDDSKRWPNSLTHHIVGGHYGYPYQFLTAPSRALPIMGGQIGGVGAQGVCYNEDGLPAEYRGNLFFCDWGLQAVHRFEVRKNGGTFAIAATHAAGDQRGRGRLPAVLAGRRGRRRRLLAGRLGLQRLAGRPGADRPAVSPPLHRPGRGPAGPAPLGPGPDDRGSRRSTIRRCRSGWSRSGCWPGLGPAAVPDLVARLKAGGPEAGRLHAIWALDAIGGPEARRAIVAALADASARVRLQAARSAGIRRDRDALPAPRPPAEGPRCGRPARGGHRDRQAGRSLGRRGRCTPPSTSRTASPPGRSARRSAGSRPGTRTPWSPPCSTSAGPSRPWS